MRFMVNNDSLFFAIMRDFQQSFKDSVAHGIDFKDKLNEHTGQDFTQMFEEWYFGEGFPTYSVKWKQEGNDVIVQVNHTASKPGVTPTFTNPIEIKFNRTPLQDTVVRFPISSNQETFFLPNFGTLSTSATAIIDPNNWVINNVGAVTQDNTLTILEVSAADKVRIYPNPANSFVEVYGLNLADYTIRDMTGKIAGSGLYHAGDKIATERLVSGAYLIEFIEKSGRKHLKLISVE